MTALAPPARVTAWFDRWGSITPLLLAEFIVWVGFGALLPVLPIYFSEQGVDLATLGLVIAAWPAARLISEPVFGWLADRTARVPLMVVGLIATGIVSVLPLFVVGAVPFIVLRAASGLSTAIYDPAARGYLTDATAADRRGEAFGLLSAAQMGGLLFGPAIGAFGVTAFGGFSFVFLFSGLALLLAAIPIGLFLAETPVRTGHGPVPEATEFPREDPAVARRAASPDREGQDPVPFFRPTRILNRAIAAAVVLNAAGYFAGGTYEVIWSLYLQRLGAGLDLIGLTFATFGLPILILGPAAGRQVDRRGILPFIVVGLAMPAMAGIYYTLIVDPRLALVGILLESFGFALLNPALFALVAAGSPPGRSSTTQGLFGAAGTVGFIVASLVAGILFSANANYPFYVFTTVSLVSLAIGLAIGWPILRAWRVVPASGEA
ncbi:MAG: MFS transporter [Chloroflexota bacterium]